MVVDSPSSRDRVGVKTKAKAGSLLQLAKWRENPHIPGKQSRGVGAGTTFWRRKARDHDGIMFWSGHRFDQSYAGSVSFLGFYAPHMALSGSKISYEQERLLTLFRECEAAARVGQFGLGPGTGMLATIRDDGEV